MDSETVDSCIQRILSSLYPTAPPTTVLRQVLSVVDSCYRGDRLRFLLHFLIPAKHFLQGLQQQDGCCSRFPLCAQEKVLIQLCRLDLRLLPSDFYLLLSPPAPAAPCSSSPARPCVVLCVCSSGRHGGGAEEVVELDPSGVFSMSWFEEVNGTRQRGGAARLKNCLLASHDHIYRVPWEEVLLLPPSSSSAPPASSASHTSSSSSSPHASPTLAPSPWREAHSEEGREFGTDEDGDTPTDGPDDQWRDSKGRSRRKLHRSSGTAEGPRSPGVTLGGCFPMVPSVSRADEGSSDSEGEYVDLCEIPRATKTRPANTRPANTHTTSTHTTSNAPTHGTHGDAQGDYIELCQLSPQRGSLTHSLLHRLRSHTTRNTASPSHTANSTCSNATTSDGSSSGGLSQTALCSRLIEGLDGDASSSSSGQPPLSPASSSCQRPLLLLTSPTPPAEPAVGSPVTSTSAGASSPTGTLTPQPVPVCPTGIIIVPSQCCYSESSHTDLHTSITDTDTLNVTQEPPAETHTPRDTATLNVTQEPPAEAHTPCDAQKLEDTPTQRPDMDARSGTHTLPDACTSHDAHTRPHTDTQLRGTECVESQCPDGSERGEEEKQEEEERELGGKTERKEREMKEREEDREMKEADEAMREEEEGEKDEGYVELEEVVEVIIVLQKETRTQICTPPDTRVDTENITQADAHGDTQQATHTDTQYDTLPDTGGDTHVETQNDLHADTPNTSDDTHDTQDTHVADTRHAQIAAHNDIQNDTHSDSQKDALADTQNNTDTENYLHIGAQNDMPADAQSDTHAGTQADEHDTHADGQTSLHVHNTDNDDTDTNVHAEDTLTYTHTDTSSHTTQHCDTHTLPPPDTCTTLSNTHSVENKLLHAHALQQHRTHCVALSDTQTALDQPEPRPEQRGEEEEEDRREEGQPQGEEEEDDVGVTLESDTEAQSTEDNIQTGTSSPEPLHTSNSSPEHLHTGSSSSEHLHTENTSFSEQVNPPPALTQQDQSAAPTVPGPVSPQCSPVFPAACDGAARPLLTAIHQLNGSVLSSGAVCLPGTRDRMGRAVVTVCTRNAVWLNPGCNGTELLRIFLYFFSTVRKEVRSLGLMVLVDARMCPPEPSVLKAISMLQDNAPGSVHMVLMLTAKDQRLDTPSNIRVVLLSSVRSLHKHIDGSQLPVELSGSFSFCLSAWLDFRKRVEQLTNQCEDAVSLLQSTINSLDTPIPVTAQEAQLLLSSNRDLMRRVLEDSRLVKLQLEGGASLSRLRKEESLSDDYRHAVQSVGGVYEQVDELVHHLVKTSNCRTQNLLFVTEFSTLEEGFKQVAVWIEDVGEVKLRGYAGEDNGDVSLQELNKKQQDFTQFYSTACSMCQRGEALLKRLESLEVVPSADLQTCEDKVRSFCLLLQDFSGRVEETRQRLHKLLLLYRFLDKAYGWSLAAMRRLAGVTMEDCSQPEKCQAVIGCLESNRQQHPPIPDEEFEEMRLLAAEVGREAGLGQWHFAWSKCQEAKRTFERKLDTALRTQRDSAHRRLSEPINSIQRGSESVYSNQACTPDSTHSSQSSIDSYHSTQTAPDSIPGNQSFLDSSSSARSSRRGSDSINNNLVGSPESNHSKRSDSKLGKQKTAGSTHSNQRSSESTHSSQRSSDSAHSNRRSSDSAHSNQRSSDSAHSNQRSSDSAHSNRRSSDSAHSNQRTSDSTHSNQTSATTDSIHGNNHHSTPPDSAAHGKQRGSGAWFCRRALSGVWGSRDRFSTTSSSGGSSLPPSAASSPYSTPHHQHFPRSVSSSSGSPRCSSPSSSVTSSPTSTLSAAPPPNPSSSSSSSSAPPTVASRRPLLRKTQSLDCPSTPDVTSRYGGASSCARGHVGVVIKGLEVTSTEVTDRPLTPRHAWPTGGDRIRTDSHSSATPPRAKGSKLGHIVDEMLCTEREYVRSLRYVVQHYYPEMERYDLPQDLRGKRSVIFGNLEKILDFHQQFFLRELEACHSHPLRVSHCFIRHSQQFGLYALYSKNKPKSDALLASHGNNFFKFKQAELGDKMDVASYLLKPIQRMSKYFLLLNELIKEVDEAQEVELTSLRGAAQMVQFQLRHGNDLLAMDAIRDCDVNLKEQGQLVRQDEFTVLCGRRKYQRHIFLFEELVLFSKPKRIEGGLDIYVYKHSYKTADVGLTESSGDTGLRFEVWFRRRTGRIRTTNQTYVLQAATAEIKHAWTADIARILWNQATRNKELRTQELLSMGVGSKPFLDIKPSDAAINDRAIDYIMKGRGARTRASIAVSVFDHSNPFKRSAVNHVTPDPSTSGPSSSLLGPLNLHMYSQTLHPPQPDISSCIEEDETSSQPSITTESSGGSSRCLSGSGGSSGSDSGCVSAHLREALCEEVGSPSCTSTPMGHKTPPLSSHYMSAKTQIIGPATVV